MSGALKLLYRGHSSETWTLQTTLERYVGDSIGVGDYYRTIYNVQPHIEAFSERTWDLPPDSDMQAWIGKVDHFAMSELLAYEYLVYLRHHGFPSPLLDWTRSPYVASFFAFHNVPVDEEKVAIYVYLEWAGSPKIGAGRGPFISGMGPYVKTHRRHFLQQSEYTISIERSEQGLKFTPHESAVGGEEQDMVWKITIPVNNRLIALREIDAMNINMYSLFGSEDSLVSTVALREFHLAQRTGNKTNCIR